MKAARIAWGLHEAAAEPYYGVVQRFIFGAYFTGVLGAGGEGKSMWGLALGAGGLGMALLSPVLGSFADAHGPRKPFIVATAAVAMTALLSLWFAAPGTPLLRAAAAISVCVISIEILGVFLNAYLPEIALPGRAGLLSGISLGFGQVGGIACLGLVLWLSKHPPAVLASYPHAIDRLTGPLAAAAMALFLIPTLLFVPDPAHRGLSRMAAVRGGLATLKTTLAEAIRRRAMRRYLIGRMIGMDGLTLIFAFGGVLANDSFGWGAGRLAQFGITVTVVAAASAFAGGALDAAFGSKRTILGGFATAALGVAGILLTDAHRIAGFPATAGNEIAYTGFACLIALGSGPAIAAMRALMAKLAPPERIGGYFGLYSVAGKATAFAGPVIVSLIVAATGSLRIGLAVALVFLAVAFWAMAGVDEDG